MKFINFTCELPQGIHARPASLLEEKSSHFKSELTITNKRNNKTSAMDSALSIISIDILEGDACCINIEGSDENKAYEYFSYFMENEFNDCDKPLDEVEQVSNIPEVFLKTQAPYIKGTLISKGFGQGKLRNLNQTDIHKVDIPSSKSTGEMYQFLNGHANLIENLQENKKKYSGIQNDIATAHLSIVSDQKYLKKIGDKIKGGSSCYEAIIETIDELSAILKNSESRYMQERTLDIEDVSKQLLYHIYKIDEFKDSLALTEDSICFSSHLTPSQFISLDKKYLKGIILNDIGMTSHTAILARSFNIPLISQINKNEIEDLIGKSVIVDGDLSLLIKETNDDVISYYNEKNRVKNNLALRREGFKERMGETLDGGQVEVAANIAFDSEVSISIENGADGIGLFRTEMLYMDKDVAPTEKFLINAFENALKSSGDKPVIIRTFDFGGDKPVSFLNMPKEANPFLGYRGVRIYKEHVDLFKTLIRSILKSSIHGYVKIMIPMITNIEEVKWIKSIIEDVKIELDNLNIPYDKSIPLGIMVEVPAVVFAMDTFSKEVDFFSVGSNDLTQYIMAADRENKKIAHLYDSFSPAFILALKTIVDSAKKHDKWVGLCGEFAAIEEALPLLIGLGFDELSMSSPNILRTKEALIKYNKDDCAALVNRVVEVTDSEQVLAMTREFCNGNLNLDLLSEECISLDLSLKNKNEVIHHMSNNLYLAGRTSSAELLANDLWAREMACSTSLGFNFAIPHAKSEYATASSISVMRLKDSIKWGDDDVHFIIMLSINKNDDENLHMKIFSKMARKLMHDDFRDKLIKSEDKQEIIQTIENILV